MAELQDSSKLEMQPNYAIENNSDPKNMQELTQYVQSLLQQMQDRFQTMSDQVINRNILLIVFNYQVLMKWVIE
ncbi:conserved hypothetical protein [Pediculus humanus corporis]|uniref:Heat shock factor binding protein n=1 Tax=Pediculus humanus subsp. corporis TaxID=121224 RepID=E0VY51_PEDHC|nr:uncharacterized protein Phum_PHUM509420 [Pediculus humanus corporis]EEB18307.1 conserved hypothetical protein [Pediculus humanus corporis]